MQTYIKTITTIGMAMFVLGCIISASILTYHVYLAITEWQWGRHSEAFIVSTGILVLSTAGSVFMYFIQRVLLKFFQSR